MKKQKDKEQIYQYVHQTNKRMWRNAKSEKGETEN